jgi:hypothetical protein
MKMKKRDNKNKPFYYIIWFESENIKIKTDINLDACFRIESSI